MKRCPCCSHTLLRHLSHHEMFWYCSHCRQAMPDLSSLNLDHNHYLRKKKLDLIYKDLQQIQ